MIAMQYWFGAEINFAKIAGLALKNLDMLDFLKDLPKIFEVWNSRKSYKNALQINFEQGINL